MRILLDVGAGRLIPLVEEGVHMRILLDVGAGRLILLAKEGVHMRILLADEGVGEDSLIW